MKTNQFFINENNFNFVEYAINQNRHLKNFRGKMIHYIFRLTKTKQV